MNLKAVWITLIIMFAGALLVFQIFQKLYSGGLLNVMLDPEIRNFLTQSMEDQRALSELDPENTASYRKRFSTIKRMRDNYYILEANKESISRRFQFTLWAMLLTILILASFFYIWRQRLQERRLAVLQTHLQALSAGKTDIEVGDKRSDPLGRIGRMIELTSGVMARQRRRLENLESLSNWQEAARRHAHEIRTPLTAAHMELNHLVGYVCSKSPELADNAREMQSSVVEELDRLKEFTQQFTSFAKIGKPKIKQVAPWHMLDRFSVLFADAWENLELELAGEPDETTIDMDKDMVRQVLVNLCNNSSLALADHKGRVTLSVYLKGDNYHILVADNGPGVPQEVRANLFKPYTTSRKIGEGMGLGLSIAKKIMLDHGGDLLLHHTSEKGTTFRISFPTKMES